MGFAKTGEGWTWGDVFPSTDLSATQPVHICIQNWKKTWETLVLKLCEDMFLGWSIGFGCLGGLNEP